MKLNGTPKRALTEEEKRQAEAVRKNLKTVASTKSSRI